MANKKQTNENIVAMCIQKTNEMKRKTQEVPCVFFLNEMSKPFVICFIFYVLFAFCFLALYFSTLLFTIVLVGCFAKW